jgi:2-polyprenyl-3-methyl-5-hydroxy-6-metoxy-1,4-benzoquinol methylase
VLEIGCGIGDTAAAIAKAGATSVEACDYSDSAIKTANLNHQIKGLSFFWLLLKIHKVNMTVL